MADTPKELWILVRQDGSMVMGYAEETADAIRQRLRPDWHERVVGPYVLAAEPEGEADRG